MARSDLTNGQWVRLEAVLPEVLMGRPPRDRRMVINAIRWRVRTGSLWRDMPERYGPWETAYGFGADGSCRYPAPAAPATAAPTIAAASMASSSWGPMSALINASGVLSAAELSGHRRPTPRTSAALDPVSLVGTIIQVGGRAIHIGYRGDRCACVPANR
ncbi:transposase [Actinoplanes sp. M2I2]|uniref:transposase n=1 Tax=Actinoplanes sp. M2I2 TaxID=1734444 RepID=UPI0035B35502